MQSSYQGAVDLHGEEEEFGNLRAEVLCHLNGGASVNSLAVCDIAVVFWTALPGNDIHGAIRGIPPKLSPSSYR
jgi:hypothetical protein